MSYDPDGDASDDGWDVIVQANRTAQLVRTARPSTSTGARSAPVVIDEDEDELAAEEDRRIVRNPPEEPAPAPAEPDEGLTEDLHQLDAEIDSIDQQIVELQALKTQLLVRHRALKIEIQAFVRPVAPAAKPVQRSTSATDYKSHSFAWSADLRKHLKSVWHIDTFRPLQEAVCNAVMDGRTLMAIMATGSGKSLCYQLPALLQEGTTVIISPLLSLIHDQLYSLREVGVEAEALIGTTTKEQTNGIMARLQRGDDIKLLYVTPEKVVKSRRLVNVLTKLETAGNLARIVIDEAHCASQQGHDFRPDYRQLVMLRKLFPEVPFTLVTATCSPTVLKDLLSILELPPVTEPSAANAYGTVLFRAPLYRANLHYTVKAKPASPPALVEEMVDFIQEYHRGQSGIVYCLSQKDTETTAQAIEEASKGGIVARAFHAGLEDAEKERCHRKWRNKSIQVICATIAFGLGVDSPDCRFVFHHSLSKNLDAYLQESGRSGRDGRDASCVLWYRSQDIPRMASLVATDRDGSRKLGTMISYASDLKTCRKLIFARYFADTHGSAMGFAANSRTGIAEAEACGHCDNCLRSPGDVSTVDIREHAWKILRVLAEAVRNDGRLTTGQLCDLVRGLGSGLYNTESRGGKAGTGRGKIDLASIAEGKVLLSKDDTESVIIKLWLDGMIGDIWKTTAYSYIQYLKPNASALRLTRFDSWAECEKACSPITLHMSTRTRASRASKGRAKTKRKSAELEDEGEDVDDGSDEVVQIVQSRKRLRGV
ncbi:hypothetical protein E5Q_06355 [Mixia osmundae IAM 14324]|uniref:ATP-dependent DNA helicase n=1 Tax=Mixia osmundae (strain CBS 9802 / IAM 14324 / JCM 22182 / KY 12970) TaxID=764103 RepID=G7E934_MIXOS|nr:hypothetical protein E5Q_06355 [Mixia osmundae IAM 14324]